MPAPTDEYGIRELFDRLWKRTGILISVPIAFGLLGLLVVGLQAVRMNHPVVYYVGLNGINNAQYPNQTAFSPRDLTSAPVTRAIAEKFGLDPADLSKNITVTFDSIRAPAISRIYQDRLAVRGLTQADIDQLNNDYASALRDAMQTGLRIDVDYSGIGTDQSTAKAIAKAVPEIWEKVFTTNYRILDDTRLQAATVSSSPPDFKSAPGVVLVEGQLKRIRDGADIISRDNRLSLVTSASGHSADDIIYMVQNFRDLYFNSILATALKGSGGVAAAYLAERKLDIAKQLQEIQGLDSGLDRLTHFQNRRAAAGDVGNPSAQEGLQLTDGGLREVVDLVDRASVSDFIKDVLNRRQHLVEKMAELQKEEAMGQIIVDQPMDAAIYASAASAYGNIIKQYRDLLSVAEKRNRAILGTLYTPVTSPMVVGSIIPTHSVIIVVIFLCLGALLAFVFSIARPVRSAH